MLSIVDRLADAVTRHPELGEHFLALVEAVDAAVLLASQAAPPPLAAAERTLDEAAAGVVRCGLGAILSAYNLDAAVVDVEGRLYRRMPQPSRGEYFSLRGPVVLFRHLYREVGVRNGATLVPLDLRAGIVDGRWTPVAAEAVAHLLQDEPSRDAVQTCARLGVLPYSRCSLERGGQALGERWEQVRPQAEDHLMAKLEIPAEARTLAVSVDRVSLPMAEAVEPAQSEGERKLNIVYRMAYCGIWTLYDADGKVLRTARYGRMPAEGRGVIEETLRGDVDAILQKRPDLKRVALADGAPEMQQMLDRIFIHHERSAEHGLDFWHTAEKISEATKAAGREPKEWNPRFKTLLKTERYGIERVEMHLRSWALEHAEDAVPEPLREALVYIDNNRERMRYKDLLDAGLPIGSGPVEATCKTLVSTRMKRSGARWKTEGGQVVLSLRSLARSSRWEEAMAFLLPTYVKPVHPALAA